jgi:predicted 3-demethylubiquinone-9 3-methyltransferase (glyoxalase superfamily)
MQSITPFLWFNDQAEEAVNFYISIFPKSKIKTITRYGPAAAKASGRPAGSIMTIAFQLDGQDFVALNGGPHFTFTPALSLVVNCKTQAEIDNLWEKLSAGGETSQCGWLRDKFGLSWQIVPTDLGDLIGNPDPAKTERVMQAILTMDKLDLPTLQRAAKQS